ncbi:MAG TPA: sugar nucleotide-binding protein [Candidatus Methylacidiphilales bacterium]|nr:sugar nucleotide-binding protein [Candidatus Methylacidiphilales bacterium]
MILLLGATGYVGRSFATFLQTKGLTVHAPTRTAHNYADAAVLRKLLRELRPDFVINAAGFAGRPTVDACEIARADTLEGNTVFALRVAEACAEAGIRWGHVSSGCVYQGDRGVDATGRAIGFREEDAPNFSFHSGECSFYSGTKALAEELLTKGGHDVYIWRLRVPFDHRDGARNYLSKLMRYKRLLDVRNSLSHLGDFVASAWATMDRGLPRGIYNLTNPGSIMAKEVVELIRAEGERRLAAKDTRSAERMLKSCAWFESEDEFMKTTAVARRSSCVLDTTKAEKLGLPLRPVREALADSLRNWIWEAPA